MRKSHSLISAPTYRGSTFFYSRVSWHGLVHLFGVRNIQAHYRFLYAHPGNQTPQRIISTDLVRKKRDIPRKRQTVVQTTLHMYVPS